MLSRDIEYSRHAQDAIQERKIHEEWILNTIDFPDYVEVGIDGNEHYIKAITDFKGRFLRVVINPYVFPKRIVTVFFDRRIKRKQK